MTILQKIKDKWQRNRDIYREAVRKGRIVGFDYTLLRCKNHTKFLLRIRNPKDRQKEFARLAKFWESFSSVIEKYKDYPIYSHDDSNINTDEASIIWMYWNDPATIPKMVKSCMSLIERNSNGCKVVLVTEKTVSKYLQLDGIIWRKYKEGKISRTHFSDIVRIALLYKYGGVWMDCTLLLTRPLPRIVTDSDFYTNKLLEKDTVNVCAGRWSTFFLACHKGNLMMRATLDVFTEYWKRYDDIAVYVWMDYVFNLLYDTIPSIRRMIDAVPANNPNIWTLQTRIGEPFSADQFQAIFNDNTRFMYKLSYKQSVDVPLFAPNGQPTLMGRICSMAEMLETK